MDKMGNIGEEQYQKCLHYFAYYWEYFIERNPSADTDEWRDIYFMVFLSGFSAGIKIGEEQKKTLIEEITESN
jgi:hypothetical protein